MRKRRRIFPTHLIWAIATGKKSGKEYNTGHLLRVFEVMFPGRNTGWSMIFFQACNLLRPALRKQFPGIGRLSLKTAEKQFGTKVSVVSTS